MIKDQIYVQKILEDLEKNLVARAVMFRGSEDKKQELIKMLRAALLDSAGKLAEKYDLKGEDN
jgi:hypothetical protein